ncbi:MAG: ribosome biogenesis GTPase Der [Deltaproteobacteria bacterium]|jgi:GTP-binding protein|nr:MAG: ribosome biogenesis GTPase Der [Deltaproteobacteria bacterium]
MLPIVAIVGRPNVGKSTLFNRLTKKRNALVDDIPGVTRDRLYATIEWDDKNLVIVDTGGFDSSKGELSERVKKQVEVAIEEADLVILLFDGKTGPVLADEELVILLRHSQKRVLYAVNKIDSPEHEHMSMEFYSLGIDKVFPISSAHGYGIGSLMEQVIGDLPIEEQPQEEEGRIKIAIIGRPNVGKSSLINRIIGSDRLIVSELPGTTRDSVDISFERDGKPYLLIDTAGIRRRGRVKEKIEKYSIIKALKAINRCHIAVILLDSIAGIYEQDTRICGYALERGCGMVIAFNKWDLVKNKPSLIKSLEDSIDRKLGFVSFVPTINISALTGERVKKLFTSIDKVWVQYNSHVSTPAINKALENIVKKHPPPFIGGKRPKFYYATQVSIHPPAFIFFVNRPDSIHLSYKRYLINQFKEQFGLNIIPIKIFFRER